MRIVTISLDLSMDGRPSLCDCSCADPLESDSFMSRWILRRHVVVAVLFAFALLGALSSGALAASLCLSLSGSSVSGSTLVLTTFKVKKGGATAVGGWRSAPGPHSSTFVTPIFGESITTSDGMHVAMGLTEDVSSFNRCPGGGLCGGGPGEGRTFHSIRLDAGSDGKIGASATGSDLLFDASSFGSNTDLGTASLTVAPCPKDLGALGIP